MVAHQPRGHALDRGDPVAHRRVAVGHHRHRKRLARAVLEARHLVHELAAAGGAPAALEQHAPVGPGHVRDAPALVAHDVREQAARVVEELVRDEVVELPEEARLVARADLRARPDAHDREVGHVCGVGEAVEPPVAHPAPDLRRGAVVGHVDHRVQVGAAIRVERLVVGVQLAQVGHQQHRLHHARRDERAVDVLPAEPALAVDDREPRVAGAVRQVARRRPDPRGERESGGRVVLRLVRRDRQLRLVDALVGAQEVALRALAVGRRRAHRLGVRGLDAFVKAIAARVRDREGGVGAGQAVVALVGERLGDVVELLGTVLGHEPVRPLVAPVDVARVA